MNKENTYKEIQISLKNRDELLSFIEFNEWREKSIIEVIAAENIKLNSVRSTIVDLRGKLNSGNINPTSIIKEKDSNVSDPVKPSLNDGYPFGGTWLDKLTFILKNNSEGLTTKEILDIYFKYEPNADKGTAMKSATGILSMKSKSGGPLLVDKSSGRYIYKINEEYGKNKKAESVSNQQSIS